MSASKNEVRITGVLASISFETTPKGKEIARMVIETDPPQWMTNVSEKDKTPITVFGKTINTVKGMRQGAVVSMLGRTRGREYNGKWYTDIIGEQFKTIGTAAAKSTPPPAAADADEDLF